MSPTPQLGVYKFRVQGLGFEGSVKFKVQGVGLRFRVEAKP